MSPSQIVSSKKTALITEASSGFGYEISRLFAQDGYNLVLVSGSKENLEIIASELEEKYKIFIKTIVKDFSNLNSPEELYSEIKHEQIKIDALVNNADYRTLGNFTEINPQDQLNMLQVNVFAPTQLTHLFIKDMITNSGGRILNVSSESALSAGSSMAVYSASKAYVLHFSEALAEEYKNNNITVTAFLSSKNEKDVEFKEEVEYSRNITDKKLPDNEAIAKEAYDGLKKGRKIVILSKQNKILAFGSKLFSKNSYKNFMRIKKEKEVDK